MARIPVGLVGVTGYAGMELVRLLAGHPELELVMATSRQHAGTPLGRLYPFVHGRPEADIVVQAPEAAALGRACRVVFLAVPHGAAMDLSAALIEAGSKVVDLSADFRLRDPQVYQSWYGLAHQQTDLLYEAVYGLPELYGEAVTPKTRLVANPGCYPSGIILGLVPALRHNYIDRRHIVADAKSGATGAGRKAATGTLYSEVSDTLRAYSLGGHRHTPEIEQELAVAANDAVTISFSPHLVPMNRGILATCYGNMKQPLSLDEIHATYTAFYQEAPWVRVLPMGTLPETRWVRGTMLCDIGLVVDRRTDRLLVVTAVDNLCRGASGQAIANANRMLGLAPTAGLELPPLMP
ncbi:MAG: N-acetyl-gamma-glutamyl-phosphate reductase [Desulfohalobium sp.]